jgi:hypothetical protein
VPVLAEEVGPYDDVAVLDISEARINVLLFGVRLSGGEEAVEVGCVRLILPVVLEFVDVDLLPACSPRRRLQCRSHTEISPHQAGFGTGNP